LLRRRLLVRRLVLRIARRRLLLVLALTLPLTLLRILLLVLILVLVLRRRLLLLVLELGDLALDEVAVELAVRIVGAHLQRGLVGLHRLIPGLDRLLGRTLLGLLAGSVQVLPRL